MYQPHLLAACGAVQVLQRDRLVSCMLEHIDRDYPGKIQVKHLMGVEGLSVVKGPHDRVSLKWVQTAADGSPAANGAPPQRGVAEAEFVVRCYAHCVLPVSYTHLTLPTKA